MFMHKLPSTTGRRRGKGDYWVKNIDIVEPNWWGGGGGGEYFHVHMLHKSYALKKKKKKKKDYKSNEHFDYIRHTTWDL